MGMARAAGRARPDANLGIVMQHPHTKQVVRIVHGMYLPTANVMVDMWVSELLGTLTTTEYMPSILLAAAPGLRAFEWKGVGTQYAVPRCATQFASAYAVPGGVRSFEGGANWHVTNDVDGEFPVDAGPARGRLYAGAAAAAQRRQAHRQAQRQSGTAAGTAAERQAQW